MIKICSKCKKGKDLKEFHKSSIHKDGLYSSCKDCKNYDKRKHYSDNKESYKQKFKESYNKNSSRKLETNRLYRLTNKDYYNKYNNDRRKHDVNFKLSMYLRTRIWSALKTNSKSDKTIKLLGCSIEELKKHLESKFQPGMTWDNHGLKGWHIDHIKPCASFDLSKSKEQKECFHYTNLQPLWAKDNHSKYCKYEVISS